MQQAARECQRIGRRIPFLHPGRAHPCTAPGFSPRPLKYAGGTATAGVPNRHRDRNPPLSKPLSITRTIRIMRMSPRASFFSTAGRLLPFPATQENLLKRGIRNAECGTNRSAFRVPRSHHFAVPRPHAGCRRTGANHAANGMLAGRSTGNEAGSAAMFVERPASIPLAA